MKLYYLFLIVLTLVSTSVFSRPSQLKVDQVLAQKQLTERFILVNSNNLWDTYRQFQDVPHIAESLSRSARNMLGVYRSMRMEITQELMEIEREVKPDVWSKATQKAYEGIQILEKYANKPPSSAEIGKRARDFVDRSIQILRRPENLVDIESLSHLEEESKFLMEIAHFNTVWESEVVNLKEIESIFRFISRLKLLLFDVSELNSNSSRLKVKRFSLDLDIDNSEGLQISLPGLDSP